VDKGNRGFVGCIFSCRVEAFVVASEFEYRHRSWIIILVYVVAYACYNLDHLNILYAIVPANWNGPQKDILVRFLYAAATLLAAIGAAVLTWASAYQTPGVSAGRVAFSTRGPFRYVRNPHYLSYFLLMLALGTFQSRLGFPVMLVGESILLFRLVAREEILLEQAYGERYRAYAKCVPRLLPLLRPRLTDDGQIASWPQALWGHAFQWGFVVTLLAFTCTLSDPVGYAFALMTIIVFVLQKLSKALRIRPGNA
jgi:protein-S-isoprenylcysteine O-methyltransferase Ste14